MNLYLNLRNRALKTLILGLVILSFYAYYRTTDNDTHPYVAARIENPSNDAEVSSPSSTINKTSTFAQSWKNISVEASQRSSTTNINALSNPTSVSVASSSISLVSQSSPAAMNTSASNSTLSNRTTKLLVNETTLSATKKNLTTIQSSKNLTNNTGGDDSAGAIYPFGHEISAAEKCPNMGQEMNLAIVVMSAPSHIDSRTAIRQTWGHFGQRRDIAILFMLGATIDPKLEKLLRQEEKLYGDVIRGRFIDSYSNLTLKTISTLEWISIYCHKVKFVLKTDDDMFINVPRLISFVKKHENERNIIFGRLARKWKPIRNKKSKYYVSTAQYKPPIFPDFTTGPAYLMSRDIVEKLFDAALEQTYLKLEDVFTTGIVAHKLGIKRSHANEFFNKRITYNPCNIQRGISIHMVKYSEQFDLWKKLLDGKNKCK